MRQSTDVLSGLEALEAEEWDATRWLALLKDAVIDAPKGVVTGRPSAAKAKAMSEAEEARVKAQVEALGPDKLKDLGTTLAAAVYTWIPRDRTLERFSEPLIQTLALK